jgi:hypothetical protein
MWVRTKGRTGALRLCHSTYPVCGRDGPVLRRVDVDILDVCPGRTTNLRMGMVLIQCVGFNDERHCNQLGGNLITEIRSPGQHPLS